MNRIQEAMRGATGWGIVALGLLAATPARADRAPAPTYPVEHCGTGAGVLQDGTHTFPLKHTRVDAEVSGPVSRVTVTQTFTNPYDETIEAVYAFPLPQRAAVTDLTIRLGDRVIRGVIERRDEARRLYEEARSSGHVAALLEQERPNLFTQSVANILPGNDVDITLEYVEDLEYAKGTYEFVFPMVVGPRFVPPGPQADVLPAGSRPPKTRVTDDTSRITPPYLPPSVRSGHDIEVTLSWDAALPIAEVTSPTHRIEVTQSGRARARVTLHPNDTIPNKDLVVRCRPEGDGPGVGVLASHDGEAGYLTLLLHPDAHVAATDVTPKEMIFVLDCSGSMSGEPMAAAKQLVRHALRNVNPSDSFQIIRFSSGASRFSPTPVPATPENVRRGIAYIEQLSGGGGTMMIEGIKAALDFPADPERLRLVMFLTDGYIGNEDEILAEVRRRIGAARLFSFGVGSSVNRFLLDELAAEGRGDVQYVLPGSSAAEESARFYERIRNPYLTDIVVTWDGVRVDDVSPGRIPDLFDGRPLAIHARYHGKGRGAVEVSGRIAGREWHQRVPLRLPTEAGGPPAIGSLWARARIADLERDLRGGEPGAEEEITRLGLAHRLVTRSTSFVAVEEQLVVSNGTPRTVRVPLPLPEGVSWAGVFGKGEEAAAIPAQKVGRPRGGAFGRLMRAAPEAASDRDAGSRRVNEAESRPDVSQAARAVHVAVSLVRDRVRAGEDVELVVTVTNRGRYALTIPATVDLDAVRLRVIDAGWKESGLGRGRATAPVRELAAGATAKFTLRLTAREAAFLSKAGTYHLILEGAAFSAADADPVTLRVEALP